MATNTPNYSFKKPDVDGDEDVWGDLLNQNWQLVDTSLKTVDDRSSQMEGRISTAEGTLTSLDGAVNQNASDVSALQGQTASNAGDIGTLQTDKAPLAGADFTDMPKVSGDPVVESGSNSDGDWTKWSDGTLICSSPNIGSLNANFPIGPLFASTVSAIWNYPSTFSKVPSSACNLYGNASSRWAAARETKISNLEAIEWSAGLASDDLVPLGASAVGRWK